MTRRAGEAGFGGIVDVEARAFVLDDPRLAEGLRPHADGWRSTKRYLAHTEAMLDDPGRELPAYPMVFHRGGWPHGS